MRSAVFDARVMLRVRSLADYRRKHQKGVVRMRQLGLDVRERILATPQDARIEHNRWLFDCVCGSGVAVHPGWPEARCMGEGCGRVYTHVVFPMNRTAIEAAMSDRPQLDNKNWVPGETVDDVMRDTAIFLPKRAR